MKGLRLFFSSWIRMKAFFWGSVVLSAAGAVLCFLFHEVMGAEDYLMPKVFICFPALILSEIGLICGCRDLAANRLMRSVPIAKELYTRSVPLFVIILTLGVWSVSVIAYFIFLAVIGAESGQYADTLICGAAILFPMLTVGTAVAKIPAGGLFVVYVAIIPAFAIVFIGGDKVQSGGFGLPVWAAVLIFAGTMLIGIVFAFWISAVRFKKSNVKITQQVPVE